MAHEEPLGCRQRVVSRTLAERPESSSLVNRRQLRSLSVRAMASWARPTGFMEIVDDIWTKLQGTTDSRSLSTSSVIRSTGGASQIAVSRDWKGLRRHDRGLPSAGTI